MSGDVQQLTLTILQVSELLGVSRNTAYALANEDMLPVPVLRLGRRILIPKEPFLRALGVSGEFVEPSDDDR